MGETNPNRTSSQEDADFMASDLGSVGLGSAGLGSAGLGSAGLGSAGLRNTDEGCAERANLDEAWVGLAQLLNANAAPLNQPALVDAVCRRLARRTVRRRQVALALAASLLLAFGGPWIAMSRMAASRAMAQVAVLPSDGVPSGVRPAEMAKAGPAVELAAWNDDCDDELARAQEVALATEESWRRPTDWLTAVRERMDALEAEFGEETL